MEYWNNGILGTRELTSLYRISSDICKDACFLLKMALNVGIISRLDMANQCLNGVWDRFGHNAFRKARALTPRKHSKLTIIEVVSKPSIGLKTPAKGQRDKKAV